MRRIILIILPLLIGSLHANAKIPEGCVMQIMEPTGGKILRPIGWFYNEGHREKSWMWTISKEDTNGGKNSYDTGVRIQAFTGVKEGTGKSPEIFLKEFISKIRKNADEVHKDCDAVNQGLFTRTCIEVTEGEYQILYSVFWDNSIDIAVISIAGAKLDDWDSNSRFFNMMSAFELIDMERFSDDAKHEAGQEYETDQAADIKNEK
jgi:hypothetical protein